MDWFGNSPSTLINVWPSSVVVVWVWSPITLEIKLSDLGSKLHPINVSKTILLLVLSSPLLIVKLNVPAVLFTPLTSHLKLSIEPDFNEPSENCSPASEAPVVPLNTIPSPIVAKVNTFSPAEESVPPIVVIPATPGLAPDPELKANPLPPVPADEPEITIVVSDKFEATNPSNLLTELNSVTKLSIKSKAECSVKKKLLQTYYPS